MAKSELKVKLDIETVLEGKPIELEFIRQAIQEKAERLRKERGEGCPANNTRCGYLYSNICIHPLPDLGDVDGKITCGGFGL